MFECIEVGLDRAHAHHVTHHIYRVSMLATSSTTQCSGTHHSIHLM
jgi:hypothetical protein